MAEEHTLRLNIDASGAASGAAEFKRSLDSITNASKGFNSGAAANIKALKDAVAGFKPPSEEAVKRMAGFKEAIRGIAAPAGGTISQIQSLKMALAGFQVPSTSAVQNLHLFAGVLKGMSIPSNLPGSLASISASMSSFRGPSAAAVRNMSLFATALRNMRLPTEIGAIVSGLERMAVAANHAAEALGRVTRARMGAGGGFGGFGGGGGDYGGGYGGPRRQNQGYGPRTNAYMYDGVLSGENRAVGEMRGFENLVNPSFQLASVARVGVAGGALTAGEGIKSLYEEGQKMIQFQHVLEVVTTNSQSATRSQHDLASMMQFATDVSQKYGLELDNVRNSFSRFAVSAKTAGFTQTQTKQIFEDMSVALRSMGADGETQTRIYRALDQIMQTGHVSMLQLHKEIGLQMPAIQIMATALGKTSIEIEEMSKKGQLGSDTLIKFAAAAKAMYLPGLATAMDSPVAAFARLRNEWLLTMDAMNNSGFFNFLGQQFNRLAEILGRPQTQEFFKQIAAGLGALVKVVVDVFEALANHTQAVKYAFEAMMVYAGAQLIDRLVPAVLRMVGAWGSIESILPNITRMMREYATASEAAAAANVTSAAASGGAAGANAAGAGAMWAGVGASFMASASRLPESRASGFIGGSTPLLLGGPSSGAKGASSGLFAAASADASAEAAFMEGAGGAGLLAASLGKVGSAAQTAGRFLLGLVNPLSLMAGGVALGVAVLNQGSDAVLKFGNTSVTVGEIYSSWWKDIKDGFSDMADSVGRSLARLAQIPEADGFWGAVHKAAQEQAKDTAENVAVLQEYFINAGRFVHNLWSTNKEEMVDYDRLIRERANRIAADRQAQAEADALKTSETRKRDYMIGDVDSNTGLSSAEITRRMDAYNKIEDAVDKVAKAETNYREEIENVRLAMQTGIPTLDDMGSKLESVSYKFQSAAGIVSQAAQAWHQFAEAQRAIGALTAPGTDRLPGQLSPGQASAMLDWQKQVTEDKASPMGAEIRKTQQRIQLAKQDPNKAWLTSALNAAVERERTATGGLPVAQEKIDELKSLLEKQHALEAHVGSGASPQQKDENKYEKYAKEFSPEDRMTSTYQDAMKAIQEAKAKGVNNPETDQRIMEGARQKLLDYVGALTPASKAQDTLNKMMKEAAGIEKALPGDTALVEAAIARYKEKIQDILDPFGAYLKHLQDEHKAMQLGNKEREVQLALLAEEKKLRDQGITMTPGMKAQATDALKQNQLDQWNSSQKNSGLQIWADQVGTLNHELGKVEEKIADELPKAMVKWIETGKLEWKGLVANILTDLAMIMMKQAEKNLMEGLGLIGPSGSTSANGATPTGTGILGSGGMINNALGSLGHSLFGGGSDNSNGSGNSSGGSAGGNGIPTPSAGGNSGFSSGGGGGILGSVFGAALKALVGGLAGQAGGALGGSIGGSFNGLPSTTNPFSINGVNEYTAPIGPTLSGPYAAEGGYTSGPGHAAMRSFPAHYFANAPHYAEGTPNTRGIPAVVHPDEAIIPLSRGRKIPVDLGHGGGRSINNHINFNITTEDADSFKLAVPQLEGRIGSSMTRSMNRNGG